MATLDKRDVDLIYEGGSGEDIEVLLSVDEINDIYGDAVTEPTWVKFAYSEEGSLKPVTERKIRRNEVGRILSTSVRKRDFVRTFTCYQSDDATLRLIEVLEERAHLYRYALDAGEGYQVWGLRNAFVTNDWEMPTRDGEDRKIQVEITASPEGKIRAFEFATVEGLDGAAQATWPDNLADFKDPVAGG